MQAKLDSKSLADLSVRIVRDRDDMENGEIYVHDTQVSKREIEIAEEGLHAGAIINDGLSILLHKLRNAVFDGALTSYKVDFLRKDITNFTICQDT